MQICIIEKKDKKKLILLQYKKPAKKIPITLVKKIALEKLKRKHKKEEVMANNQSWKGLGLPTGTLMKPYPMGEHNVQYII